MACQGKSQSQGGMNVPELFQLAKGQGYTGEKLRQKILDFLCKPAAKPVAVKPVKPVKPAPKPIPLPPPIVITSLEDDVIAMVKRLDNKGKGAARKTVLAELIYHQQITSKTAAAKLLKSMEGKTLKQVQGRYFVL